MAIGVAIHDFSLGGTERVALRLARAWSEKGARVTLFCGDGSGPLADLAGSRVEIVQASPPIMRARGSRRRLGRWIARDLKNHPVDIVFVPGNYHWPVIAPVARLGKAAPHQVAQISAALRKPQRGWLRQWLFDLQMARLLRRADALVAMTDDVATQAKAVVRGPLVTTIPTPALDSAPCPPVPPPTGDRTIVAVGRLVPEKGFGDLIEAFARITTRNVRLVIVGEGPDEARLRGRIAALDLDNRVALPGYVADSRPWLDAANLFVLSSWFEGFPAVLVEALAAGRPVIATGCTPATALLDRLEGAGMVVPIRAPQALAEAIDIMLAKSAPEPQALADLVAGHRIDAVADAYLALFGQLLAGTVSGQRARP